MSTRGTGGAARRAGNPKRASGGCLSLVVLLAVLLTIAIVHNHSSDAADPTPVATVATGAGPAADPATDDAVIEAGDCLSVDGDIPTDSTETVDVSDITEVDCSSSDAKYKVVGVVPLSTDMNACVTDYPSSTVSLLDQGAYFSSVYCAVDNG
ncbi:hypothetical protein KDL01_23710 [Actinospica durhamensis]|uniref:Uncharacterized protein n=1 Tax=Actinospica durhamensis TaxID=1508375 RepID=A0A941ERT7_9ACTN|nr:hypothetical protein [Actinospica durhamensis]MBR7836305.1 hypothetical protein [Actinospica durhamensis]